MQLIKHIILFIFLFLLIYFDPVKIGSVNWATIWKSAAIIIILLYKDNFISLWKDKLCRIYIIYSIFSFFNASLYTNPFRNLALMVLNLILPVFLLTISKSVKTKNDGYKTMQFISLFVILSFLPFVCNILQQNRIAVNEDLVSPDRQIGLSGLFVSVHGASFMLAYSVLSLILILQILKNTWQKFLLLIIAIIGISFTIQTYARTGFIMLIAGIVTFLFYKIKLRKIPQVVFLLILTTIVSYGLLQADSTMWQRLTGNAEGQEYGNADSYSSGRLQLWENSLKSYTENHSIFEFVFGIGESELLARNGRKGGAHFAHNGFINTLTTNGIIGLTLLLLFLKNWFSLIRKPTPNNIYASKYSMSVFIMYLVYMLFQGGASVYDSMFIALSIHIKRLAFTEQKCVK